MPLSARTTRRSSGSQQRATSRRTQASSQRQGGGVRQGSGSQQRATSRRAQATSQRQGGGVRQGSGAQQRSISRRTDTPPTSSFLAGGGRFTFPSVSSGQGADVRQVRNPTFNLPPSSGLSPAGGQRIRSQGVGPTPQGFANNPRFHTPPPPPLLPGQVFTREREINPLINQIVQKPDGSLSFPEGLGVTGQGGTLDPDLNPNVEFAGGGIDNFINVLLQPLASHTIGGGGNLIAPNQGLQNAGPLEALRRLNRRRGPNGEQSPFSAALQEGRENDYVALGNTVLAAYRAGLIDEGTAAAYFDGTMSSNARIALAQTISQVAPNLQDPRLNNSTYFHVGPSGSDPTTFTTQDVANITGFDTMTEGQLREIAGYVQAGLIDPEELFRIANTNLASVSDALAATDTEALGRQELASLVQ